MKCYSKVDVYPIKQTKQQQVFENDFQYFKFLTDLSVEALKNAEILFGDPPVLSSVVFQLPKLKWMHSTYAGVNSILEHLPDKQPSFVLTRPGGIFGPLMAEYVVGQIIARERKFALSWQCQKDKVW